jgi:hypothetical protein
MKSTSDVAVVSPPAAHAPSIGTEGRRHDRTIAFDRPDVRIARERLTNSATSEWHDHGDRSLARAGDSFHVPAGLVHRDVNPDDAPQDYLVWLVGSDPRTVPVDGPDPVGSDCPSTAPVPSGPTARRRPRSRRVRLPVDGPGPVGSD